MKPPAPWPLPPRIEKHLRTIRPTLVVAIHGILTNQTEASWPDRLDAHLWDCKVLKREYAAGPFPIWNTFIKNHQLAAKLVAELALFGEYWQFHIVAHSNGCDVALKTAKQLAARGRRVETLILTGSITHPSVTKSGVLELVREDRIGRAFAYCSEGDLPLRLPFRWPYYDLGRRGWADVPDDLSDRIVTRWFPGYGHGGYFGAENRGATFERFREDMGIA